MVVNYSSARRVFAKTKDGNWLDRALPFLERFRTAPFGEQRGVIKELAALTGQAENTARRMLVALQYLYDKGVDLPTMSARPPVMSIEAVLRVGKRQAGLEDDLLRKLLRDEGTAADFRKEADRLLGTLAVRTPITDRVEKLSRLILGSIIPDPEHRPQFWAPTGSQPRPCVVVDVGSFRLSVFTVTGREPYLAKAIGYRLLEAAVLKAVVTSSRTVVCSEIPLDDLKKIRAEMRAEQDNFEIEQCVLEDDLHVVSSAYEHALPYFPDPRDDDLWDERDDTALEEFYLDYDSLIGDR